jgi:hypothetical protein
MSSGITLAIIAFLLAAVGLTKLVILATPRSGAQL